jgi:hypothetical protein
VRRATRTGTASPATLRSTCLAGKQHFQQQPLTRRGRLEGLRTALHLAPSLRRALLPPPERPFTSWSSPNSMGGGVAARDKVRAWDTLSLERGEDSADSSRLQRARAGAKARGDMRKDRERKREVVKPG